MPDVSSSGLSQHVRPEDPFVAAVFAGAPSDPAPASPVEQALAAARARFRYVDRAGSPNYRRLKKLFAASEETELEINCISSTCLLVSRLRQVGLEPEDVFVALGGQGAGLGNCAEREFHSWCLVRQGGEFLWIDPADLEVRRLSGHEVLENYRIYSLFNDRRVLFLESEKAELLVGDAAPRPRAVETGRLVVFGAVDAALEELLDDGAFRRLPGRLQRAASLAVDAAGVGHELLARAAERGFVELADGRVRRGPRLGLVGRQAAARLAALAAERSAGHLAIVEQALADLEQAYAACALAEQWPWQSMALAVGGGLLLDLHVGAVFQRRMATGSAAEEAEIWALEQAGVANGIGVRCAVGASGSCFVGQLWHQALDLPPARLGAAAVDALESIARGRDRQAAPEVVLFLRHQGVVTVGAGGEPRIVWPVFDARTTARLAPILEHHGERLFENWEPLFDDLAAESGWESVAESASLRHAALRVLMDDGVERVFEAGLLKLPAPERLSAAWGRWVWIADESQAVFRRLRGNPEVEAI